MLGLYENPLQFPQNSGAGSQYSYFSLFYQVAFLRGLSNPVNPFDQHECS